MDIALFGATGRLGGAVLEAALREGHRVRALVRDPRRLSLESEALTVIVGDARDRDAVERALRGGEAAVCALASAAARGEAARKPLSAATANIVGAMERLGISRLVASSAKAIPMPGDMPGLRFGALRAVVRLLAPESYEDSREAAGIIAGSPLDWTLVRVDRVSYGRGSGAVLAGPVDSRMRIGLNRIDAADFLLGELEARAFLRGTPAICSLRPGPRVAD
jgi:hypothetical protein